MEPAGAAVDFWRSSCLLRRAPVGCTRLHRAQPLHRPGGMDIQELDQQMAARRASSRQPKPTSRALEGAEQEHLKFNARCTPGQLEKERREQQAERAAAAKRARKSKDQWVPAEGDLVWAHYDGWYDHYSAWREVAHALPCSSCWLTCLTPPACAFEHRPWWPATLTDAERGPGETRSAGSICTTASSSGMAMRRSRLRVPACGRAYAVQQVGHCMPDLLTRGTRPVCTQTVFRGLGKRRHNYFIPDFRSKAINANL